MQLYDDPTTVAAPPALPAAGTPGYFTDGSPGTQAPTVIRGWWLNLIAQELVAVVTAAGLTPSRSTANQVLAAINALIAAAVSTGTGSLPKSYPPNGAAGGVLSGNYPSPGFAAGVIPTALPPNGAAGGDLAGNYPSPTVAPLAITNVKMAQMAAGTIKGNNGGSAAAPSDLTSAQLLALLGFSYGSNGNGTWEKKPSGEIVQKGFVSGSFNEATQTITLPTPFPNSFKGIVGSVLNAGPANNEDLWLQMQTTPGSGAFTTIQVYIDGSTSSANVQGFYWEASGT